jgi:hypothetical protein
MLFSCLKAIPLDRIIRVWYLVRQESLREQRENGANATAASEQH